MATARPARALSRWQAALVGSTTTTRGRRSRHASQNAALTEAATLDLSTTPVRFLVIGE